MTYRFKGLVAQANCNYDSSESELGLILFCMIFYFILLEDEQNLGAGVFVQPKIITSYVLLLSIICSQYIN